VQELTVEIQVLISFSPMNLLSFKFVPVKGKINMNVDVLF